jgi:hypothetical protein
MSTLKISQIKTFFLTGLLLLAGVFAFASGSEEAAEKGGQGPSLDGVFAGGEYRFVKDVSGMRFGCTYSAEGVLYLAVSASTTGWVALGVCSDKMDGAEIFLAADRNGVPTLRHDRGKGKTHSPEPGNPVTMWKVSEQGGVTTLELEMSADGIVKDNTLPVILAYGGNDDFSSPHKGRAGLSLVFK